MHESRRVAFATLGCKVNLYDTEAVMSLFRRAGYDVVDFDSESDVYIINTCTVTGRAAAKSRQLIRQAVRRSPLAVVAVMGCYTQTNPEDVAAITGVDLVVGNHDHQRMVEMVEQAAAAAGPVRAVNNIFRAAREFEDIPLDTFATRTRAVVKVQDGCNIFCTFCIIPYARGKPRSRRPESVLAEVDRLAAEGYREVVLTGVHLGSYGKDAAGEFTLEGLVESIAAVPGIDRVRLSSLEPGHVTDRLIDLMTQNPRVCPHLHLSLQSGSAGVLERMRRAYTAAEYRERVERIGSALPDVGLTTDIIVGFPGETVAEHAESMAFVREMGFMRIHVFPYSAREGTRAAGFPDQLPKSVKEQRVREMIALGDELAAAYGRRFLGRRLEMLAEEEADAGPGWLEGYTGNYIRVRIPGGDELRNTVIPVRLTGLDGDVAIGDMDGQPVGSTRGPATAAAPGADALIWLPMTGGGLSGA